MLTSLEASQRSIMRTSAKLMLPCHVSQGYPGENVEIMLNLIAIASIVRRIPGSICRGGHIDIENDRILLAS